MLMPIPIGAAIAAAAIPSVVNGLSSIFTNKSNQDNYVAAQERANQFAREERLATQRYNSLENQYAQMANVGMNPNLLTGQSFEASSPMPNQSVAPPLNQAPAVPAEPLTQAALNLANKGKTEAETITIDAIRDNLVKTQGAEYEFKVAQKNVEEATLKNTQKQFEVLETTRQNLVQSIIESDARTQNIREDTAKLRELKGTWRREADKNFERIVSEIATNKAQAAQLLASRVQLIALAEQARENTSFLRDTHDSRVKQQNYTTNKVYWDALGAKITSDNLTTAGKISQWQLGQYETYGDLNNTLDLVNGGLQVVDKLIQLHPATQLKKDVQNMIPFANGADPSISTPYNSGNWSPSFSR